VMRLRLGNVEQDAGSDGANRDSRKHDTS
jgi:hypothetical protein